MLRQSMPKPESILWERLRDRALEGQNFRRQYSVGNFVIDFYCPALRLALEIDGDSHFVEGAQERDRDRQDFIESHGIVFLRFTNRDVCENIDGVLRAIVNAIQSQRTAK